LKGLDQIDLGLVSRARKLRQESALAPALLAAAAAHAQLTAAAARHKVQGTRSVAIQAALTTQASRARAAKAALLQRQSSLVRRSPGQVLQQLIAAARSAAAAGASLPPSPRAILLRGHAPQSDVASDLARALELLPASVASLQALGFKLRRVSAPHAGKGELYSVRAPLAQPTTRALHDLVWALRKSERFASVRLDGLARNVFAVKPTHIEEADPNFAWPLHLTRCLEAHGVTPASGGKALGEGIVIAHPDTGWAPHPQYSSAQIDTARSYNAATERRGGDAARHSIRAGVDTPNITHGTATGSVIVGGTGTGRERSASSVLAFEVKGGKRTYAGARVLDPSGQLTGVAPRASVRPLKFINDEGLDLDRTGINGVGVVRFHDEDLVDALEYARSSGAHVISLSVGGIMHDDVQRAIDQAVEKDNLIVVAAAGQLYTLEKLGLNDAATALQQATGQVQDSVVLPAAYANVIACAGCCPNGKPWDESLSGPNVDITAPADGVWVADFVKGGSNPNAQRAPTVEAASGTSFAAAFMAGVAALWLAHLGRENLRQRYPRTPLAWVFRHQLQRCATAVPTASWDRQKFGPGVIDVKALLECPLPRPSQVQRPPATRENAFTILSAASDSPIAQAVADVWSTLYDTASATLAQLERLADVAWVLVRASAEATLAAGQQALADLQALVDAGQATLREVEASLKAAEEVIESAAELAEDAVRAAAEAGADAVDALVDVAKDTGDALGEAAEEATEFLFGWL
jgi:thermitase